MGKSHDNEDNDGLFVPRYPVYHFQDSGQLKNEQFGTQNEQAKKN